MTAALSFANQVDADRYVIDAMVRAAAELRSDERSLDYDLIRNGFTSRDINRYRERVLAELEACHARAAA
jgi:uncharacterized protein Smg (DUF494 family)